MARTANRKLSIDVVLLEQNPLAERYLKGLLRATHNIKIIGGQRPNARKMNAPYEPSILIIDAGSLPAPLGRYLRFVRTGFPKGALLMLGKPLSSEDLCRLLMMGVKGYIPYDEVEKDLSGAIDSLRQGRMWVPAETLEQFALFVGEQSRPKQPKGSLFTEREKVILGLLHRRLSNKEIGSALGIADRTVKFHMEKIFDKLGVRDRQSAAEMFEPSEPIAIDEMRILLPAIA